MDSKKIDLKQTKDNDKKQLESQAKNKINS
jgi:hypothetical protein